MENKNQTVSSCLKCPITSLCFVRNYLLCGEGSYLRVYNINNKLEAQSYRIFENSRIHLIRELDIKRNTEENLSHKLLLLGAKCACIVTLMTSSDDSQQNYVLQYSKTNVQSFQDWVWDGFSPNNGKTDHLLVLTAHNHVYKLDVETGTTKKVAECVEQCILYAGYFFETAGEVIAAAGTVFNQILLWKPLGTCQNDVENISQTNVWKRLYGHQGVIFSLRSSADGKTLLSVSDDRSIRVWDIATESCCQVLYGHSARVWRALFLHGFIVSVGEDAQCHIWNKQGSIVKSYKGHKGKSIWSLAVDEKSKLIATGAGDGSIRLWKAKSCTENRENVSIFAGSKASSTQLLSREATIVDQIDKPRTVAIFNKNEIIVMTENGCLKMCTITSDLKPQQYKWSTILKDNTFESFCATDIERHSRVVVMGNLTGTIKCVRIDIQDCTKIQTLDLKIFAGKIFNVFIQRKCHHLTERQDVFHVTASGPDGIISHFTLATAPQNMTLGKVFDCKLPFSQERWATSVSILCKRCLGVGNLKIAKRDKENDGREDPDLNKHLILVCGDRRGSLHIFELGGRTIEEPKQSFIGLHGKTGVTSLTSIGNILFSTGRDGAYQRMRFSDEGNCQLLERKKACKGMDWIENLKVISDDILIYGFYMQAFLGLWSVKRNELLLKIQCGGGYRSWDLLFYEKNGEKALTFAYLKGNDVNITDTILGLEHQDYILQESLHGREITCIILLKTVRTQQSVMHLLATGSEDTTVNILLYCPKTSRLKPVHLLEGHIGGVKSLASFPLQKEPQSDSLVSLKTHGTEKPGAGPSHIKKTRFILFSCGSRTSLKCWIITVIYNPASEQDDCSKHNRTFGLNLKIESHLLSEIGSASDILKRKRQHNLLNDLDDLRFLSVDIFKSYERSPNISKQHWNAVIGTACSDGYIRVYGFDSLNKNFLLLASNPYHHRCVLSVKFHVLRNPVAKTHSVLMVSAGTDGCIAIWEVTAIVEAGYDYDCSETDPSNFDSDSYSDELTEKGARTKVCKAKEDFTSGGKLNASDPLCTMAESPLLSLRAHQSGINEVVLKTSDNGEQVLILSGGDDNSICINIVHVIFSCDNKTTLTLVKTCTNSVAHLSSITGIAWLPNNFFCSCSVDQRIRLWKLNEIFSPKSNLGLQDSDDWSMEEITCTKTDVADVSSMVCFSDGIKTITAVCGIGIEIIKFDMGDVDETAANI